MADHNIYGIHQCLFHLRNGDVIRLIREGEGAKDFEFKHFSSDNQYPVGLSKDGDMCAIIPSSTTKVAILKNRKNEQKSLQP